MRRGTVKRRCATCNLSMGPDEKTCRRGHSRPVWHFSVDVGAVGGRRRRVTRSGFKTKAEAVAAMAAVQVDEARGVRVEPSKIRLGDFLAEWVDGLQLEAATVSWYRSAVERHIVPALGEVPLQALTPQMVERFLAEKARSGRLDGAGGLGATSLRRLVVTLRKAMESAVRKRLIPFNPVDLAERPKVEKRDVTEDVWDPDTLRVFLAAAEGERLYPLWWLAAWTGLRREELCGLQWRDLDLETGALNVRRARTVVDGRPVLKGPKTESSRRVVELDPETVRVLRSWRRRQAEERLSAGEAWEAGEWVFTNELGAPLHPQLVTRAFQRAVKHAGLPPTDIKGLRHAHATALLKAGVHPKVVQERLGHSSIQITLDVYSSVIPGMQREAVAKLAAAFGVS